MEYPWEKYFVENESSFSGYVHSIDQFQLLLNCYEEITHSSFISDGHSSKSFGKNVLSTSDLKMLKYYWVEPNSTCTKGHQITFDGHPTAVLGSKVFSCKYGTERHGSSKQKLQNIKDSKLRQDHPRSTKRRKLAQDTTKLGCTAVVRLREVIKLTDICIPEDTQYNRRVGAQKRTEYLQSVVHPNYKRMIYVSLPEKEDHDVEHLKDTAFMYVEPIDPRVLAKIEECVHDGVVQVTEFKRRLEEFVSKELFPGLPSPPKFRRKFYPSDRDIRNHIQLVTKRTRMSDDDQRNVELIVQRWQKEKPDHLFFRKYSASSHKVPVKNLLFLHQTPHQQRILQKYGNNLCLLDATYRTCKYDLPLFQLCVSTCMGYSVVATFIVQHEDTVSIKEALQIVKGWNPSWQPEFFLTDFDLGEINAIEAVFKECSVLLCKFHREQAWDRWLSTEINGMRHLKEIALKSLRELANAPSEDAYQWSLERLKASDMWKEKLCFQRWMEKTWLPHHKRWVKFFRNDRTLNYINTTNGVESKHRVLKHSWLTNYSDHSLEGVVKTMVLKYIPAMEIRYNRENIRQSSLCRRYNPDLLQFLKDRPSTFLQHCLDNIPPKKMIELGDIKIVLKPHIFRVNSEKGDGIYDVNLSVPVCSCPAWEEKHLPCKHMLGIFNRVTWAKWDMMPDIYINHPVFLLDTEVSSEFREATGASLDVSVQDNLNSLDASVIQEEASEDENYNQEKEEGLNREEEEEEEKKNTMKERIINLRSNTSRRNKCIFMMKHIQQLLTLTDNGDTLTELALTLNNCLGKLKKQVPTYNGLHRFLHNETSLRVKRKSYSVLKSKWKKSTTKKQPLIRNVHRSLKKRKILKSYQDPSNNVASGSSLWTGNPKLHRMECQEKCTICQKNLSDRRMLMCRLCGCSMHGSCMGLSKDEENAYLIPGQSVFCNVCKEARKRPLQERKQNASIIGSQFTPQGNNSSKASKFMKKGRAIKESHGGSLTDLAKQLLSEAVTVTSATDLQKALIDSFISSATFADTERKLKQNCATVGLTFRDKTPGDGNCFFHAVGDQIQRISHCQKNHFQIRQTAVEYLKLQSVSDDTHQTRLAHIYSEGHNDWQSYLNQMSNAGIWADHLIIIATAKALKRDIHIVKSSPQSNINDMSSVVTIVPGGDGAPMLLAHFHENHYQSLGFSAEGSTVYERAFVPKVTSRGQQLATQGMNKAETGNLLMDTQKVSPDPPLAKRLDLHNKKPTRVAETLQEINIAENSSRTRRNVKKPTSKVRVPVKEKCLFCDEQLVSMVSMRRHMYLAHYVCIICTKPCHSKDGLDHHVMHQHKITLKDATLQNALTYVAEVEREKNSTRHEDLTDDGFPSQSKGLFPVFAEDPYAHIVVSKHDGNISKVLTGYGDFFTFSNEHLECLSREKSSLAALKQIPVLTSPAFLYFILNVRDIIYKYICWDVVSLNEKDFDVYQTWLASIAPEENSE